MLGIWIGLVLLFGALSQNFLTARTFGTVANRIPTLAVVAAGMTLVLIIGGIDLSVGSVLGLSGSVLGVALVNWGWPMWAASLLCLAVGLTVGTVNGWVSVRLEIPSFIVTLGMLEIARGLANYSADEIRRIQGRRSDQIAAALGHVPFGEVIHRDNLALVGP